MFRCKQSKARYFIYGQTLINEQWHFIIGDREEVTTTRYPVMQLFDNTDLLYQLGPDAIRQIAYCAGVEQEYRETILRNSLKNSCFQAIP